MPPSTTRPRRRSRYSSRSPSPTGPSQFLQLPTELLSLVVTHLPDDLHSLSETCRTLYELCRREYLQQWFASDGAEILEQYAGRENLEEEHDDPDWTMYCFEGAKPGERGYEPFVIRDAFFRNSSSEASKILCLSTITPNLHTFAETRPAEDTLQVWIGDEKVGPSEYFLTRVYYTWEELDWDEGKGALLLATPDLVRARFTCPECRGTRSIWVGSLQVSWR